MKINFSLKIILFLLIIIHLESFILQFLIFLGSYSLKFDLNFKKYLFFNNNQFENHH
jgi:hypothetical protein